MGALAEDQKAIENVLEGERKRAEENLRIAAASRKAREEKPTGEASSEDRCVGAAIANVCMSMYAQHAFNHNVTTLLLVMLYMFSH